MINSVKEIIGEEDYETIQKIAEKNNMSVNELGSLLVKKVDKYLSKQIRFTEDEIELIDKKAKSNGLSRSKLCRMCYMKAYNEKLYEDIDVMKASGSRRIGRHHVISVSFDDADEYNKMLELSKFLSIPFASLLRYFVLTVELDNKN